MANADQLARRKLPFWRTVDQAFGAFFANPITVVRTALPWIILTVIISAVYEWAIWIEESNVATDLEDEGDGPLRNEFLEILPWVGIGTLYLLITILLVVSLAVAWHRWILQDEPILFGADTFLDRMTWRYGFWFIVLGIIMSVAFAIAGFWFITLMAQIFSPSLDLHPSQMFSYLYLTYAGVFALIVYVWVVVARLSLILPAVALGHDSVTAAKAWTMTKGNSLRLLFGPIVCCVPIVLLEVASSEFPYEGRIENAISNGFYHAAYVVLAFPTVSFLSYAYRFLFLDTDRNEAAA